MAHIAHVSFTYILEMHDQNGTSLFYHYPILYSSILLPLQIIFVTMYIYITHEHQHNLYYFFSF